MSDIIVKIKFSVLHKVCISKTYFLSKKYYECDNLADKKNKRCCAKNCPILIKDKE